jgi:hypothetical protein
LKRNESALALVSKRSFTRKEKLLMWLFYFWSLLPRWGWGIAGSAITTFIGGQLFAIELKDPVYVFIGWTVLLVAVVLLTLLACLWPEKQSR